MLSALEVQTGVWSDTTDIYPSPLYPNGATFAASYTAQLDLAERVLLGARFAGEETASCTKA